MKLSPRAQPLLPMAMPRVLMTLAAVGLITMTAGVVMAPERFWGNWLLLSYYALTLALGGLCFVAIHYSTGATWSIAIRRIPEAVAAVVPFAALVVGVVLVARPELYSWTADDLAAGADSAHALKHTWLSRPFFLWRSAGYMAVWAGFAWTIRRQSRLQDEDGDPRRTLANRRLSAAFLVLFAVTFSLAAFDWVMSLEPEWYSTIFSVHQFAGLFVSALAAVILLTVWLERAGPLAGIVTDDHFHDLGKLLFAFTTFWAYVWFSQYMLIWYANISEETIYFVRRTHGWWLVLFMSNLVLNWVIPFATLLQRKAKRSRTVLTWVACTVLVGRWVDLYIAIFPSLVGEAPRVGVWEVGMAMGAVGFVVLGIVHALGVVPVVPAGDPQLEVSLHYDPEPLE